MAPPLPSEDGTDASLGSLEGGRGSLSAGVAAAGFDLFRGAFAGPSPSCSCWRGFELLGGGGAPLPLLSGERNALAAEAAGPDGLVVDPPAPFVAEACRAGI